MAEKPSDPIVTVDDDIYISSSEDDSYLPDYNPKPPEEQTVAIAEENAAKASSYPILSDIADWFEDQISKSPDITNIAISSKTIGNITYRREIHVEAQVLAYQMLKDLLSDKYEEYKEFRDVQADRHD
jgi:hypothetical protein